MINRNQIAQAVSAKLKAIPGIAYFSRRFSGPDQLNASQFPAIIQQFASATIKHRPEISSSMVELTYDVGIYVNVGNDQSIIPDDLLDPLVDAVQLAFMPAPGVSKQTLGLDPMVQHAWVDGTEARSGQALGSIAIACVSVRVLAVATA